MTFDGQQQRKALTALERAVNALAKDDVETAERAAGRAAELDQIGVYSAVPEAIGHIGRLRADGEAVPDQAWEALLVAVGPGPVAAVVEQMRDGS